MVGMIQSIGTTVGWIYTSQGQTKAMFHFGIVAGVIRIVGFIIGLRWGVIGVAVSYAVSQVVITPYSWTVAGRLIGVSFLQMVKSFQGPLLCATAMGIIVWTLGLILSSEWPAWGYLAVQIPAGFAAYVLFVHLFKVQAYLVLRQLISEQWQLHYRGIASSLAFPDNKD